jgi:hypothetical protein
LFPPELWLEILAKSKTDPSRLSSQEGETNQRLLTSCDSDKL